MKIMKLIGLICLIVALLSACDSYYNDEIDTTLYDYTQQTILPSESSTQIQKNSILEIHYIDVGQADCSLILCEDKSMLIDGGNVEDGEFILSYLIENNINTIDYMICTHGHEDHIGGLLKPLTVLTVNEIFIPKEEADTNVYTNFKNKLQEKNIKITNPKTNDVLKLGNSIITFYVPDYPYTDDLNNTSIMCKITYGNTSFLFTGDAEREEEYNIMRQNCDLSADVLKVGHHGSDTSTIYPFLRNLMPKYAVISVGKDNSYGHPNDNLLSRLNDADVEIFRTDIQGNIIIKSDGNNIIIETQK